MTDHARKRQTYIDRIERLAASYRMSQDGDHRAYCEREIALEQDLLAQLDAKAKKTPPTSAGGQ